MLGQEFSLVDCDYGPTLNVLEKAGFSLAEFPKVKAYLDATRAPWMGEDSQAARSIEE